MPRRLVAPVHEAYRSNADLEILLGTGYPEAAFDAQKESVTRDVLEWLGLDDVPRAADLLKRIEQLTASPPDRQSRATAHRLLDYFAERSADWDETFVAALKERAWMTADGHPGWHPPPTLYQRANRNWFSSQATFHDAPNERNKTDFLRTLGLETVPPAALATRHLVTLAERNEPAPWTLYEHLDAHTVEAELELIEAQPSILVDDNGTYAPPGHVFQSRHPFGSRRYVLPAKLRGLSRLLEALDITSEPNAFDAKDVLEEFAAEPDLVPADASVVYACWSVLQTGLDSGREVPDLESLGSLAVALDGDGRLITPRFLLFNDAPTLAERLAGRLGPRLIARQEDTWRALTAAGAQNLSDAVSAEILGTVGESLDPGLVLDRLRERARLLARVVEAFSPGQAAAVRDHARSLRVDASTELLVRYHLDDDSDDVYGVRALYDRVADTLHVTISTGRVAWTECAKELARALAPSLLPHVIAPSLRAVLEPATADEAETELNDLDIPRLEDERSLDWERAGEDWSEQQDDAEPDPDILDSTFSGEVDRHDQADGAEPDESEVPDEREPGEPTEQPPFEEPSGPPQDRSESHVDGGTPTRGSSTPRPSRARRPRTPGSPLGTGYLETFLVVAPDKSNSGIASEEELENMAIDRAGTNAVIRHEEKCRREPLRKPHSWPGYDVESYVDGELERIIEIKSIDGPWDAARARLSKGPRSPQRDRQIVLSSASSSTPAPGRLCGAFRTPGVGFTALPIFRTGNALRAGRRRSIDARRATWTVGCANHRRGRPPADRGCARCGPPPGRSPSDHRCRRIGQDRGGLAAGRGPARRRAACRVDRGVHVHRAGRGGAEEPDRPPGRGPARRGGAGPARRGCSSAPSMRTASGSSSSASRGTRPTTCWTTTSSRRSCPGRRTGSSIRQLDAGATACSPRSPRSSRASTWSRTSCSTRPPCPTRSGRCCAPTTRPSTATGCSPTASRSSGRCGNWSGRSWPPRSTAELRHLIVDEYQDVNPAQERLIELLTGPQVELCVVGDDQQAIYQWRGSDVSNIVTVRRPLPAGGDVRDHDEPAEPTADHRGRQRVRPDHPGADRQDDGTRTGRRATDRARGRGLERADRGSRRRAGSPR